MYIHAHGIFNTVTRKNMYVSAFAFFPFSLRHRFSASMNAYGPRNCDRCSFAQKSTVKKKNGLTTYSLFREHRRMRGAQPIWIDPTGLADVNKSGS